MARPTWVTPHSVYIFIMPPVTQSGEQPPESGTLFLPTIVSVFISMKQAQPDPWEGVAERFPERCLAGGHVTRLAAFGAFVELSPGVEGLIHISELSDRRVRACDDVLTVGQEIETRVLGVDLDARRISLSLKQVSAPADTAADGNGQPSADAPKPPPKRKRPRRGGLSSHYDW